MKRIKVTSVPTNTINIEILVDLQKLLKERKKIW